jgi:hypothetical protein
MNIFVWDLPNTINNFSNLLEIRVATNPDGFLELIVQRLLLHLHLGLLLEVNGRDVRLACRR